MKTETININNKEYILCFSLNSVQGLIGRYGDTNLNKIFNENDTAKGLDETIWVLNLLMVSGKKYAEINGLKSEEVPSAEDLKYIVGVDDIKNIQDKLYSCIRKDVSRNVDLEVKKTESQKAD